MFTYVYCRWWDLGFLSHTYKVHKKQQLWWKPRNDFCASRHADVFPDLFPNLFPDFSPTFSRLVSRPFPSHREIISSHPIPSTFCLPAFPSRSHPAVHKREGFPVPLLGKTLKHFSLRRAKRSRSRSRGNFVTANSPDLNGFPNGSNSGSRV